MNRIRRIAAGWMALAIAAGAFAAHGAAAPASEWLKTGSLYAMIHGLAGIVIAPWARGPAMTLLFGTMIFAGTLYAMAAGAPRWFGAITPIGGVAMIAGWLWLAFYRTASRNASTSSSDTDLST